MANDINTLTIAPEGFQFPAGKENATILAAMVDEHYFDTMGIAVVEGRNFRIDDDENAPRIAIVNQHLARHYWPNQEVLGKRFRLNDAAKSWVEIVGVTKTGKYVFVAEAPSDFIYVPERQRKQRDMVMVAQSVGDPTTLVAPLREVVRGLADHDVLEEVDVEGAGAESGIRLSWAGRRSGDGAGTGGEEEETGEEDGTAE